MTIEGGPPYRPLDDGGVHEVTVKPARGAPWSGPTIVIGFYLQKITPRDQMLRLALTAILLVTLMRPALAAPGDITTIAGSPGRGNPLTLQQSAQALFGVGSKIYVADGTSRVVRVIDTSTDFEDLVAGVAIPGLPVSGAATAALAASLPANLSAVALDANGNTFIGDETSFRVRRVDALTGLMSFVIGTGASGSSGNGVSGLLAQISGVSGLAFDTAGRLYLADYDNCLVRRWDPSSDLITTFVGTGTCGFTGDGGPAASAEIESPRAVAFDSLGRLLISTGNRIRRVEADGSSIDTIAGTGGQGSSGDGGPPTGAQFNGPAGIVVDALGTIYIADSGNERVRKIAGGVISTYAGGGLANPGDGGLATDANLGSAISLALAADGDLLIGQFDGIRRVDSGNNVISRYAGGLFIPSGGDGGPAVDAQIAFTQNIAVEADGGLLLAQEEVVRRIAPDGTISTVAGGGNSDPDLVGIPALSATIGAAGIAIDPLGGFFIGDYSQRVFHVDSGGIIRRFAGTGNYQGPDFGDGGPAVDAQMAEPFALATDSAGNLIIADQASTIRRVDRATGIITRIAGSYDASGSSGDNGPATASLVESPRGVAVDSLGNVFIADTANNKIRKIDTTGIIRTIAGTGVSGFNGNEIPATTAQVGQPMGIAFDLAGNLYVSELDNYIVRRIDTSGTIHAFAGTGVPGYSGDGGPATLAQSFASVGAVAHASGAVFMVDGNNTRIRRVSSLTCGDGVLSTPGEQCDDGDQIDNNACSTLCRINPSTVSQPAAAASEEVSTGSIATPADPIQAAVTFPSTTGGAVTITKAPDGGLTGVSVLSGLISIHVTPDIPPTVGNPLVLKFTVDAALVPPGELVVTKDGAVVPACTTPGSLSPSPSCVSTRVTLPSGDLEITVLTLTASDWTVGDVCGAAPATGCKEGPTGKSVLLLKKNPNDSAKDLLTWTWANGAATTSAEFAAPLDRTPYSVCIYDDSGLKLQATALAGGNDCGGARPKACWKQTPTGYTYGDKALTPDGLQTISLKAGTAGKSKIVVKGRGLGLGMPSLPLSPRVRVQLKVGAGAEARCWEASFSTLLRAAKPAEMMKAKSD